MSGVTLCLDAALAIQRAGLRPRDVPARLGNIPAACAQPLICAHRHVGCREVNARYLRDVFTKAKASCAASLPEMSHG